MTHGIMTAFCHVSYVSSKEKQMASRIWQEISCPPSHRKGRDSPRPTRDRHAQRRGSLRLRLRCRRRLPGSVRRRPSTTCPGDGGSSVENPCRIRGEQLINGVWISKIKMKIRNRRSSWTMRLTIRSRLTLVHPTADDAPLEVGHPQLPLPDTRRLGQRMKKWCGVTLRLEKPD